MRCPVAYHTSCLPKNCAQNFPGKRIICPKHESSSQMAAPAIEVSSSTRSSVDAAPVKDKKPSKESKSSKNHGSERGDKDKARSLSDRHTTEDDKAEGGDDVKNEDSGAMSSSTKKLSKSTKREKKKKKKKRKKQKKHESKSRGHGDDEEEGEDESTGAKRAASRTDSDDDDDDDENENESASNVEVDVKRESPYDLPALSVTFPDAVSPATSSSLFESPATTNERIKARLVEALGQSDDDVESLGSSPITLPKPKVAKVDNEEIKVDENESLRGSPGHAVDKPSFDQQDRENVKQEVSSPVSLPAVKESASPLTTTSSAPGMEYESSYSASGYASNSQSSGEKPSMKGERKVRNERAASMDGRDLSRQLSEAASDHKSSKKQKHGYSGLLLQIPGSPELNSLGGVGHLDMAEKNGSVSEGEEGDDEGPGGSSTPTLRRRASTGGSGTPRGETAGDLKGKATSSARVSKKKKKKKTKGSTEHSADATRGGDQQDGLTGEEAVNQDEKDEAKWVQCDSCKKWRTVPKSIDLNSMPERWYCKMNTWDAVYASCAVAEEIANATSKKPKSGSHAKKSKSKSRAKPQLDAQEAAVAGGVSDGGASSPSSGSGSHTSKKALSEPEGSAAVGGDTSKLTKKQEKQAKKRKLKLKLKEKYREVKWVQCESAQCGKWRVVPSSIDFNLLPTVWYCHLNTWTPEVAKCSAPNPPEVEAYLMKSHSKKGNSSSSSGSRPSKKLKPSSEALVSTPTTIVPGAAPGVTAVAGGHSDAPPKPSKPAKAPKNAAPSIPATAHPGANSGGQDAGPAFSSATTNSAAPTNLQPDAVGGAAAGSSAQPISHNSLGISNNAISGGKGRKVKPDGIKKTVLEWAQCEKCNKWRKLPQHIKSSTLPDKWYCTMNHWDPARASCSIPEEVDQEPVGASPLPSSQNWYPMPGQVSGNGTSGTGGMRSKRSKLSYTELLYASTGQLRKTYTSESSTLTFEHDGRTYQRDDQYKDSSMYVSPDSLTNTRNAVKQTGNTIAGVSDNLKQTANSSADTTDELASDNLLFGDLAMPNHPSVEQAATMVLDSMDVRRSSTIVELFRAVNEKDVKGSSRGEGNPDVELSLSLVTAAVSHLVQKGLIEKQDGEHDDDEQIGEDDEVSSTRVGSKRRKPSDALFSSMSAAFQYRKVPKRPLKASKCWRLGQSAFEFLLKE